MLKDTCVNLLPCLMCTRFIVSSLGEVHYNVEQYPLSFIRKLWTIMGQVSKKFRCEPNNEQALFLTCHCMDIMSF
ncbi:hypothetical protein VNO77_11504 [Canavalia gladiata]|uniref:Uncharacterized protein n=1 Tax=Canavalia gladiata TaxID=3824 RepID=A0AAN9QYE0_CANGL